MTQNTVREKIIRLHKTFNMPYSVVGKVCGVSPSYIRMWIAGDREVSDDLLQMIDNFYNDMRKQAQDL